MLTAIEIDTVPCVARMSSAYVAGVITPREYNAGLRVAALEDSVKKLFHRTTWSKVEVGDVVLMARAGRVDEVVIEEIDLRRGALLVAYAVNGRRYSNQSFGENETVYVQSRL